MGPKFGPAGMADKALYFISDSHVQREDSDAFQNISDDIEVEASYRGVHLTFPLTLNQLHKMVQAFRRKQVSNLTFFSFYRRRTCFSEGPVQCNIM